MLELLTGLVTCYLIFWLWLIPQMMAAVPMDTKYWKVKLLAALVMLIPVYLGLQWGVYRCSGMILSETSDWAARHELRLVKTVQYTKESTC